MRKPGRSESCMESNEAKTKVSSEEVPVGPTGDADRGQCPPRFTLYLDLHMANTFISLKPLLKCPLLKVS